MYIFGLKLYQRDSCGCQRCRLYRSGMSYLGHKVSYIGPQMGQNRDFFKSNFRIFWFTEPKCSEICSEKVTDLSLLGSIWLTLWPKSDIPGVDVWEVGSVTWCYVGGHCPRCCRNKYRVTDIGDVVCYSYIPCLLWLYSTRFTL